MACHGIEALSTQPSTEIIVMLNPANHRLIDKLSGIKACRIQESPCETRPPQCIRTLIDRRAIQRLAIQLKALSPDLVLCIQGDIEQSSLAARAAHQAGIECVSYIALPHSKVTMGAKLGTMRDLTYRHILNLPSRYICISESMAALLQKRGVEKPITVVRNGITLPSGLQNQKAGHSSYTLGLLGRIEFKQKAQDFMVQAFCDFPETFNDIRLCIAGDGPDRAVLAKKITHCSRREEITLLAWQDDVDGFFSHIDLLAVPSRYEGVPLVMLEALARGVPVIGSNRDGMQEILPEDWTFETGNAAAFAETFSHVRDTWQDGITPIREKVLEIYSLDAFKTNFCNAVLGN